MHISKTCFIAAPKERRDSAMQNVTISESPQHSLNRIRYERKNAAISTEASRPLAPRSSILLPRYYHAARLMPSVDQLRYPCRFSFRFIITLLLRRYKFCTCGCHNMGVVWFIFCRYVDHVDHAKSIDARANTNQAKSIDARASTKTIRKASFTL